MIRSMANVARKFIGSGTDAGEHPLGGNPDEPVSQSNTIHHSSSASVVLPEYGNAYSMVPHSTSEFRPVQSGGTTEVSSYNQGLTQSNTTSVSFPYEAYPDSLLSPTHGPQCHTVVSDDDPDNVLCVRNDFEIRVDYADVTDGNAFRSSVEQTNVNDPSIQGRTLGTEPQSTTRKGDNWKKNVRKKQKNLGKAYTMQNGKVVHAKVFKLVTQCCSVKCFQSMDEDDQKNGFTTYWNIGDWNKQTRFLWDHIQIRETARKTVNSNSRRVHTRHFYVPNSEGEKVRVCKKMFMGLLQISNGRLSYTLSQKVIVGPEADPRDRRGLNTPLNKTPFESVQEAEVFIQSLPYYKINTESGKKVFYVPQGVTIRKVYSLYQRSLAEKGKLPISLKVFRKLLPDIHKKDALSVPLPLVHYHQYKKAPLNQTIGRTDERRPENLKNSSRNVMLGTICTGHDQSSGVSSPESVDDLRYGQNTPVEVDAGEKSDTLRIPSPISSDITSAAYFESHEHVHEVNHTEYQEIEQERFCLETATASAGLCSQLPTASNQEDQCENVQSNWKSNSRRKNLWSRSARKKLRDEGKSYVAASGKVVWRKEFVPQHTCCFRKCHQLISVEQQEVLFRSYWALGSWNLQTKFLWDHIEVHSTKSCSSKFKDSRRVHTRNFYLYTHDRKRSKVCKVLFCTTLQISNGRLARAVNLKISGSLNTPQDKRGKNPPSNKASVEDTEFMMQHVFQMVQQFGYQTEMLPKLTLPSDMTMKAAHETYKSSCTTQQNRKPLCYTMFARALHKEMDGSQAKDHSETMA